MTIATDFQDILDEVLFAELGSTVTRLPYASQSVDKWGDATTSSLASEDFIGIPYNLIDKREDFQPFGDVQEGETVMVIKYSQSINQRDTITFDGTSYIVKQIEKFPLANENLVTFLLLAKNL